MPKVPAKKRLRTIADQLWSLAIRNDWVNCCAVCGSRKCEAHHLVPRQHEATRYSLDNGISLCATHHQFCKDLSPHQNAVGFWKWLCETHPLRAQWLEANCRPKFDGQVNAPYLIAQIRRLRRYVEPEDFTRIVGVRFEAWLEENE